MGKYAWFLACLLLTACTVDGYEPPEKSSVDSGVDSSSAHLDSGSVDAKPDSQSDAGADVATADRTDSENSMPDAAPDSGVDSGAVDSGVETSAPDATPDAPNNDPCDVSSFGKMDSVWDCYGSCPKLPGENEIMCAPNKSDDAEASVYPPKDDSHKGHIVLLPGYYRFRVEQGGCAKFTSVGSWKFVVDDEHYAADFSKATSCLVVSGWGHPEGHMGVLVQAKSFSNGVGRIDFESVKMPSQGTCSLSCP